LLPLPLRRSWASNADDPVEPLPVAPPVLATSTSSCPLFSVSGPVESDATSWSLIPAGAQARAIAPTVAASRALGAWYPMRTVSGAFLSAARAPTGSDRVNWSASAALSAVPNASSVSALNREFAIGAEAFCAIWSRGVHRDSARRAGGAAIGPWPA
jgi:hypothetical protein